MTFEDVKKKIDAFIQQYPDAEYGPAHVVVSDYNLSDYWLMLTLVRTFQALKASGYADATLIKTMEFLSELADIPENERDLDSQ